MLVVLDLFLSVIISASVVTFYTMCGGMWSVAYADCFQFGLTVLGLCVAVPFALDALGGFDFVRAKFVEMFPESSRPFPPFQSQGEWTAPRLWTWWDTSFLLMLGGIPWNCYFQRVLSCRSPRSAVGHSIFSGVATILLTIPPLLLGMAAAVAVKNGSLEITNRADALPILLRDLVPPAVGMFGLLVILGAVTSSYSSSILSAGTMLGHNVIRPLIAPNSSDRAMRMVVRVMILFLGLAAVGLALQASGSVYDLWTFSADLVYVLLFPQLVMALYDPKANRIGSIVGFVVSLILRLGGGVELFRIPQFIDYPEGFPYKTLAAAAGIVLIPLISRCTTAWNQPRPLEPDK